MIYLIYMLLGIYASKYLIIAFATVIWLPIYILYDIVIGRTFVFDEHGCTVKIYNGQRKYTWDELIEKRVETGVMRKSGKYEGVLFSPCPVRKPKGMNFLDYALLHPRTAIIILFKPKNSPEQFDLYAVDKPFFMQKNARMGN